MANHQHAIGFGLILAAVLSAVPSLATDTSDGELYAVCRSPVQAIPDNDPLGVSDTLTVSTPGKISDLDLWLDIAHTWVGDLVVTLEYLPTATFVTLVDRPLDTAVNGCAGDDVRTLLDDEAPVTIEYHCIDAFPDPGPAYPLETYMPGDPPAPLLASFDGEDFAGDWRLTVSDHGEEDTGTLGQWCLVAELDTRIFTDGFESGDVSAWSSSVP